MDNNTISENHPEAQRQAVNPDDLNLQNNNANIHSSPYSSTRQQVIKQEINTLYQSNEVSSSLPTPTFLQQENIVSSSSEPTHYNFSTNSNLNSSITEEWCCTTLNVTKFNYIWAISNFSYCREEMGEVLKSTNFSASKDSELKWCLKVNPRGLDEDSKDYLSLYLSLEKEVSEEVRAKFKFSILNSKREESKAMESQKAYKFVEGKDWGFKKFIRRDFLMEEDNGLLPDDVLTLLCEVSVVGQETTTNIKLFENESEKIPVIPSSKLAFDLSTLLTTNSEFSDVTFLVENEEVLANKAILACRSPVFMAMFKKSKKPFHESASKNPKIQVTDMSPIIFKKMLNFIYTDRIISLEVDQIEELLAAADRYQLERLKIICERKLCQFITVTNVCSILVRADMHGSGYLKEKCLEFINHNCLQVTETESWNLLAEEHPRLLVSAYKSLAKSKLQITAPVRKRPRTEYEQTVINTDNNS